MISKKTLTFLRQLKKNNNKPWFDEHKSDYLAHKAEFKRFLEQLRDEEAQFDPAVKRAHDRGQKTVKIFRIYRDIRFSKDKTRFKTNLAGMIATDATDMTQPAYYLSIQSGGGSFVGGGIYLPERKLLSRMRDYISENYKDLAKITQAKKLLEHFPDGLGAEHMLKTGPRGFELDHPAIEFLRYKSFTVGHGLTDAQVIDKSLFAKTLKDFKAMSPVVRFLRQAVKPIDPFRR